MIADVCTNVGIIQSVSATRRIQNQSEHLSMTGLAQ
jgi:hypothetical protein